MQNLNGITHAVHVINNVTLPAILNNIALHVGEYKLSAHEDDFRGWLLCDGRSISRTTYTGLFDVIGTKFGANDGDTFKLPDFRGRVIGQPGQGSSLTNRVMGAEVGSEAHTLTDAEMPAHTHAGTTLADGAHIHGVTDPGHSHTQTTINDDFNSSGTTPPGFTADSAGSMTWNNINSSTTGITINSAGSHTHAFTSASTGGGLSHNNMQPTLFGVNVFIFGGSTFQ